MKGGGHERRNGDGALAHAAIGYRAQECPR